MYRLVSLIYKELRLQRDGKLLEDAKRILDIRVNVYKPSGNTSPKAGKYGESDWKLEKKCSFNKHKRY